MSDKEQCWSHDREDFSCDTLRELIDCNDELEVGSIVYIGEKVRPDTKFVDASDVIEWIGERAYDIGGEHADGFPDVDEAAKVELDALLSEWQAKHLNPPFYQVKNIREYTITSEDLGDDRP